MMFKRRKKDIERLLNSFGQIKEDSFNFKMIEKYFRGKDHSGAFQILSDKVCNDLDFNYLFGFVDRTNSKIGQQFLYNKLRVIPFNLDDRFDDEELIEKLSKDDDFRVNIQIQLEKLNDVETYYLNSLFQDKQLRPPKWFFIIRLLSFTSLFSLLMLFFNLQFFFVLLGVFIINIVVHYWNKKNLYQYLGSIPQLLKLHNIAQKLFKVESFKRISPNLQTSINKIKKVRNRMSFLKLDANLQGDLEVFIWGILEIFKILFLLDPLLLFSILKQLESKKKAIEELFAFVGQVDSIISIASLRKGLESYCVPSIYDDKMKIVAEEVYHPLINKCVSNDISVTDKSILLTGSNMSGKTSFIRTIGLNIITGLTINTCFAKSMSVPRTRIYSAIRISDDLINDKSYYFEEVLTIKEILIY